MSVSKMSANARLARDTAVNVGVAASPSLVGFDETLEAGVAVVLLLPGFPTPAPLVVVDELPPLPAPLELEPVLPGPTMALMELPVFPGFPALEVLLPLLPEPAPLDVVAALLELPELPEPGLLLLVPALEVDDPPAPELVVAELPVPEADEVELELPESPEIELDVPDEELPRVDTLISIDLCNTDELDVDVLGESEVEVIWRFRLGGVDRSL